jgi:hypothetical protein
MGSLARAKDFNILRDKDSLINLKDLIYENIIKKGGVKPVGKCR